MGWPSAFYLAALLVFSSYIFIDLFNKPGVHIFTPFSQNEYISLCTPQLRGEEAALKKRIETLRVKGLYKHCGAMTKLSAEMKKVQVKVCSLEMKESMGGDTEIQEKIHLLTNGFHLWFDLVVFEIQVLLLFLL
jgi:hypothetical protein